LGAGTACLNTRYGEAGGLQVAKTSAGVTFGDPETQLASEHIATLETSFPTLALVESVVFHDARPETKYHEQQDHR